MVLAQKLGQRRSFWTGLLLTVVTFGIYAIFWNYKAHNELYRQFELEREDRDEGMVWYVLGLTLQPLLVAYLWIFSSNVAYLRERIGLARRMTPGKFVALAGSGVGALAVGIILVAVATYGLDENAPESEVSSAVSDVGTLFVALSLLGGVLVAFAYSGLQKDINELWDAYDARIQYLSRHPEELALRPAYMSDLAAGTQLSMTQPLRAEVDRLRERHADLRALPQLEELIARADAGEVSARESGEQLLSDLAGALQERAELLRLRDERAEAGLATDDLDERLTVVEQALFAGP